MNRGIGHLGDFSPQQSKVFFLGEVSPGRYWFAQNWSVPMNPMNDVTRILNQIENGDPSRADELLLIVYDEMG